MRISDWSSDVCSSDLTQRRFRWDAGLHPVLQNLGPEGWLRRQQARSGHVEQEDDLGILLRYGRDCIGAISVEPVESRSEERRGGKEGVHTCRSRWAP